MADFTTYLLQPANLLIVASVWVVLSAVRQVLPAMCAHHLYARIAPVLPILLCVGAVFASGAEGTIAARIMLGIVLGAMAANGHKIFRQTALGDDQRIRNRRGVF